MNLHEDIRQYIADNADEFDTKPDSIYVGEHVDYDTGRFKYLELTGYWETDDDDLITDKATLRIDKYTPFYNAVSDKIQDLRSTMTLTEGKLERVTIRQNTLTKGEHDYVDNYPFYTQEDCKFDSMSYVESDREPTENISGRIKKYVQNELGELDPDISKEQIVEIELAYDDFAECELIGINGYVITPNPHRYYSDIDSFEEYITTLSKRDKYDYDELKSKDNHRIFYRIDDPRSDEKPPEFANELEPLMMDEMNSIVSVTDEFMFEAEAIVLTDYTHYDNYEPEQYGYTTSEHSEYISFYVRQPIYELD